MSKPKYNTIELLGLDNMNFNINPDNIEMEKIPLEDNSKKENINTNVRTRTFTGSRVNYDDLSKASGYTPEYLKEFNIRLGNYGNTIAVPINEYNTQDLDNYTKNYNNKSITIANTANEKNNWKQTYDLNKSIIDEWNKNHPNQQVSDINTYVKYIYKPHSDKKDKEEIEKAKFFTGRTPTDVNQARQWNREAQARGQFHIQALQSEIQNGAYLTPLFGINFKGNDYRLDKNPSETFKISNPTEEREEKIDQIDLSGLGNMSSVDWKNYLQLLKLNTRYSELRTNEAIVDRERAKDAAITSAYNELVRQEQSNKKFIDETKAKYIKEGLDESEAESKAYDDLASKQKIVKEDWNTYNFTEDDLKDNNIMFSALSPEDRRKYEEWYQTYHNPIFKNSIWGRSVRLGQTLDKNGGDTVDWWLKNVKASDDLEKGELLIYNLGKAFKPNMSFTGQFNTPRLNFRQIVGQRVRNVTDVVGKNLSNPKTLEELRRLGRNSNILTELTFNEARNEILGKNKYAELNRGLKFTNSDALNNVFTSLNKGTESLQGGTNYLLDSSIPFLEKAKTIGKGTVNTLFVNPLKSIALHPMHFAANIAGTEYADKVLEKAGVENLYIRLPLSFTIGGGLAGFGENAVKHLYNTAESALYNKAVANKFKFNFLNKGVKNFVNNAYIGDLSPLGMYLRRSQGLNPFILKGNDFTKVRLNGTAFMPTLAQNVISSGVGGIYADTLHGINNNLMPESIANNGVYQYFSNYILPTMWGNHGSKNMMRYSELKSGGADNAVTGLQKITAATKAHLDFNTSRKVNKLMSKYPELVRRNFEKYVDNKVNRLSTEESRLFNKNFLSQFSKKEIELINKYVENEALKKDFSSLYRTTTPAGGNNFRGSQSTSLLNSGYAFLPDGKKVPIASLSGYTTSQFDIPINDEAHYTVGAAYHNRLPNYDGSVESMITALGHLNGTKNEGTTYVRALTQNKAIDSKFNSEAKDLFILTGKDSNGNPILEPLIKDGQFNLHGIRRGGIGQRSNDFDIGLKTLDGERILENVDGHRAYPLVKKGPNGNLIPAYTVRVDVAGGASMNTHSAGGLTPSTIDAFHDLTVNTVRIEEGHPSDLFAHTGTAYSNLFDQVNKSNLPFGLRYWFGKRVNRNKFKNIEQNSNKALSDAIQDLSTRQNLWNLYSSTIGEGYYKRPNSTDGVSTKKEFKSDKINSINEKINKSLELIENLSNQVKLNPEDAKLQKKLDKEVEKYWKLKDDLQIILQSTDTPISELDMFSARERQIKNFTQKKKSDLYEKRIKIKELTKKEYDNLSQEDKEIVNKVIQQQIKMKKDIIYKKLSSSDKKYVNQIIKQHPEKTVYDVIVSDPKIKKNIFINYILDDINYLTSIEN